MLFNIFLTNDIMYKMLKGVVNDRWHKCIHYWKPQINTKDKYNLSVHFIRWPIILEETNMANHPYFKKQTHHFHTWASLHSVCFKLHLFILYKSCKMFQKRNDGTFSNKHYFTHRTQDTCETYKVKARRVAAVHKLRHTHSVHCTKIFEALRCVFAKIMQRFTQYFLIWKQRMPTWPSKAHTYRIIT